MHRTLLKQSRGPRYLLGVALFLGMLFSNSCQKTPEGVETRITWYLSTQVEASKDIELIQSALSNALSLMTPAPTLVIRPPHPGEQRPLGAFPLSAQDQFGASYSLWSSLVMDQDKRQIVIPDAWDPSWFSADWQRALEDLEAGSPRRILLFPDSYEASFPFPRPAGLEGRWALIPWGEQGADQPGDVLLLRDSPGLDFSTLRPELEAHLSSGGGIIVVPSPEGAKSNLSLWAQSNSGQLSEGRVIYLDDFQILNDEAYIKGLYSFRELDTALLIASGRELLLERVVPKEQLEKSRAKSLSDFEPHSPFASLPKTINSFGFIDQNQQDFRLIQEESGWFVQSEDWKLPAREDRVDQFLNQMALALPEARQGGEAQIQDAPLTLWMESQSGKRRTYPLLRQNLREGVWVEHLGREFFLPLLFPPQLNGDARYWMELRPFRQLASPIRGSLESSGTVLWQLTEQNGNWLSQDGSLWPVEEAQPFWYALPSVEALSVLPARPSSEDSLLLIFEESTGGSRQFELVHSSEGTWRLRHEGLDYLLPESLLLPLLQGPHNATNPVPAAGTGSARG